MLEFLTTAKYFGGFTFVGHFTMDINHFKIMYEHYKKTGENLLDSYCEIIHLDWEVDEEDSYPLITDTTARKFLEIINKNIIRKLFSRENLLRIKVYIHTGATNYRNKLLNDENIERQKACSFTSRQDIKDWVFEKHGKICLACGTNKNISLDHVIPIIKKGENIKENLQPLCKPCNSRKHDKIIDYRNKNKN